MAAQPTPNPPSVVYPCVVCPGRKPDLYAVRPSATRGKPRARSIGYAGAHVAQEIQLKGHRACRSCLRPNSVAATMWRRFTRAKAYREMTRRSASERVWTSVMGIQTGSRDSRNADRIASDVRWTSPVRV